MFDAAFAIGGVTTYPVTIIEDGFGKDRPAQVSACSLAELRNALRSAEASSTNDFVVVSHNFEMLKTGSSQPDWVVVKRFRGLCAYLAKHPIKYNVRGCDPGMQDLPTNNRQPCQPKSGRVATAWRYVEQVKRRLF